MLNDLLSAISNAGKSIADCPVSPAALVELIGLIDAGKISGKQGKEVFAEMFATGKPATLIVKEKGLEQLSDTGALEALVDQVIAANPKPVADFKAGNPAPLNFLKGQVMKRHPRGGCPGPTLAASGVSAWWCVLLCVWCACLRAGLDDTVRESNPLDVAPNADQSGFVPPVGLRSLSRLGYRHRLATPSNL